MTLINEGTGTSTSKPTASDGSFEFDFVRVGTYRLRIAATGFKTLETGAIELAGGATVRQTYALEVGQVNETVAVESTAPLVNTVSSEQSQSVSTLEASELPLSKRNVSNLLGLGTGVSPGAGFVRLNGVGKTGTLYTVDGTNATADPESRTTSMRGNFEQINLLSLEAVQQVETTKGILPAEYGQVLGGNVNLVTRSGTNSWHGSAFENFQSDNLNARLQFLSNKPNAVFNQFGGSLGGPLKRDRAFFFADYEGYRQSITQVISGTVPTPDFRQLLITTVPAYATPLQVMPLPNQSYAPGADTALYIGAGAQTANDNHVDVKNDIRITNNSNLSLTYTHGRPDLTTPRIFLNHANDQAYHGYTERGTASYVVGAASWTSETRFGYNLNDMSDFGPVRNPNHPYNPDGWVNLAPRFGFSYDVTGKSTTTVRGGYGVMFSPVAEGVFSGAVGGKYLPFRTILSRQDGINNNLSFPVYNDTIAAIIEPRHQVQPTLVINPNFQMPYVLSSYLGVQHQLTPSLVLETAYVGNRGVKFPLNRTYNLPDRVTGIRPNPSIGQGYYLDNSQTTWYHSWQTSLRKRLSHNLTFGVGYTWGKEMATDSGDIGAYYQNDANVRAQNFFNLRPEWGPADGDVTNYFSGDWVYQLPALASSHGLLRQAFGGWRFSGIFSPASGQPIIITETTAENVSRPDISGNPVNSDYARTLQYLNKSSFILVPISAASGLPVRPGNLGRGAVRGPGFWNADLSLGKDFTIAEKVRLELRIDSFNALNHTNLSGFASTDLTNASFGRFTNTRGARVAQLNGRLTW